MLFKKATSGISEDFWCRLEAEIIIDIIIDISIGIIFNYSSKQKLKI